MLSKSKTFVIQTLLSDHYPILVSIEHANRDSTNNQFHSRLFNTFTLNDTTKTSMERELAQIDQLKLFASKNCSDSFSLFYHNFIRVINSTITM